MPERVLAPLLILLAAALAGNCAGSTTMSTRMTRVPMLLGPVACIGCPPSPAPQWNGPPPIVVPSAATVMASGGGGITTRSDSHIRPTIGLGIGSFVPDPCRADVRVSRLSASAYGVFALFFFMSKVEMTLEGYPLELPSGSCTAAAPVAPASPVTPGPPVGYGGAGSGP
jgi:hypothetical protein